MSLLIRVVHRSPLPKGIRLSWGKALVDREYAKDIALARKAKDNEKVELLERDQRFEIELIEEEEDQLLSAQLIRKAKHLRVPIPRRFNDDGAPSPHWYEGNYLGGWYLTNDGISKLREEIRKELRARHDSRVLWVTWISALTGVIGALTGLLAIISKK